MQPVSAADAIGLAFAHTRTVLAPVPFRLGRFFKLALAAAVTQASFLSVSISYPLQGGQFASRPTVHRVGQQAFSTGGAGAFAALGLGLVVGIMVLALLFALAYIYLFCRARATLFDLVVFREGRVRQAWRRRAQPAWRYFGLSLLAMLLFWTVLAALLGPIIVRFVKVAAGQAGSGLGAAPSAGSLMLTLVGLVWLLLPLWIAVDALLQDFILPGLALQPQAPVGAAFSRLGGLARRRPGQLLLFLLLRTVVAFAAGLALGLLVLVAVGLVALLSYGVGKLLYSALWTGGVAGHTVFFACVAALALVVAGLYLLGVTAVYGITGTFKTSYAAYFYAGYYPELAAALEGHPPEDELVGAALPLPLPPLPPLKAKADIW